MTEIQFSDIAVNLIGSMGSDASIVQAARVSLSGENEVEMTSKEEGLINYLMRNKHGSPFEHTTLKFYVKAPIFVFREFHRHRIGFSYNEMSGRYTKLKPEFYLPSWDRPLINVGTSASPDFAPGDEYLVTKLRETLASQYRSAWNDYEELIAMGVANEVARVLLPVGIMSQMYVTCNVRSMMSFLSLRTQDDRAAHVSKPQLEIQMVARQMEEAFAGLFPVTYASYNTNQRVAP